MKWTEQEYNEQRLEFVEAIWEYINFRNKKSNGK